MGRDNSVLLSSYFQDFVFYKFLEGRYKDASEIIWAGLRLLEEEENKTQVLKSAIQEGIKSGVDKGFHPKKQLESLRAGKLRND